jgi:hypothetical protein
MTVEEIGLMFIVFSKGVVFKFEFPPASSREFKFKWGDFFYLP